MTSERRMELSLSREMEKVVIYNSRGLDRITPMMFSSPTSFIYLSSSHDMTLSVRPNPPGEQRKKGGRKFRCELCFIRASLLNVVNHAVGFQSRSGWDRTNQCCDHMQQFKRHLLQNKRSLASVVKVVNELFTLVGNMPANLKDRPQRPQNEWNNTRKTMTQLFHFPYWQCLTNLNRSRKEIEESKELIKKIFVFTELQLSAKI